MHFYIGKFCHHFNKCEVRFKIIFSRVVLSFGQMCGTNSPRGRAAGRAGRSGVPGRRPRTLAECPRWLEGILGGIVGIFRPIWWNLWYAFVDIRVGNHLQCDGRKYNICESWKASFSRVANDHDRDQIFGLDCPIPTDSNRLQAQSLPIIVLHRPEFWSLLWFQSRVIDQIDDR